MKLFTCKTNYDLTEGRGWEVPTVFTLTLNDALYFAHTHRLFYDRPQSVSEHTFGELSFGFGDRISTEGSFYNESLGSNWNEYIKLLEKHGEILPKPAAEPQVIYVVGAGANRKIGDIRYQDVFTPDSVFFDERQAVEYAQKKLALADELYTNPRVFKLLTNTTYGVCVFNGEPHYVAVKPEAANRDELRFAELKRTFEVSNG
jgi:hypothetical protein